MGMRDLLSPISINISMRSLWVQNFTLSVWKINVKHAKNVRTHTIMPWSYTKEDNICFSFLTLKLDFQFSPWGTNSH